MRGILCAAALVVVASASSIFAPSDTSFASVTDDQTADIYGGACVTLHFKKGCGPGIVVNPDGDVEPPSSDKCVLISCLTIKSNTGDISNTGIGKTCSRDGTAICGVVVTIPRVCAPVGDPTDPTNPGDG